MPKKGYSTPRGKNILQKNMKFVWHVHYTTISPFCKYFFSKIYKFRTICIKITRANCFLFYKISIFPFFHFLFPALID